MPFVPAINTANVGYVFTLDSEYVEINQEVSATDLTTAGLLAIGATALGAFADTVLPFLSNDLQLLEVVVTDVSTEFGPVAVVTPTTTALGGIAEVSLPGNCALCVTKMTAARGKSARGRFFLPGLPTDQRAGPNRMSTTWMADVAAGLVDMFAAFTADSFEPVIVSRITAGADRGTGLVQVMTQYRIYDNVVDSQRRRLPGRGS